MTRSIFTACLFAALFSAPSALLASHIDSVVDGGFLLSTDSFTGQQSGTQTGDAGNVLGVEREVSVDVLSGSGFVTAGTLGVPIGPVAPGTDDSKTILLSNSVSVKGQFDLLYNGVGSAGLGGVNLQGDWDHLDVHFAAVQGAGELTLTIGDTAANGGSLSMPVTSAGTVQFPFGAAEFAGVDLTAVDSVHLSLATTEAASDFSISAIDRSQVPEPTGVVMITVAALGLAACRRRR